MQRLITVSGFPLGTDLLSLQSIFQPFGLIAQFQMLGSSALLKYMNEVSTQHLLDNKNKLHIDGHLLSIEIANGQTQTLNILEKIESDSFIRVQKSHSPRSILDLNPFCEEDDENFQMNRRFFRRNGKNGVRKIFKNRKRKLNKKIKWRKKEAQI